jgi:uncharacterized protein RhaS with RHS repeats
MGRYISQVPIGLAGGTNHYEYAGNPVSMVDPLGLETCALTPRGKMVGIGGHSALYISRGFVDTIGRNPHLTGMAVLYDPDGGYHQDVAKKLHKNSKQNCLADKVIIPNQIAVGSGVDKEKFKNYHKKDDVTMVCKDTTEEEEKELINKVYEHGHVDPFACASAVSSVIKDSKAFPGVKDTCGLPGDLERAEKK